MRSKPLYLMIILCLTLCSQAHCIDTIKLKKYFDSLEDRNEAMASISIAKAGEIIYSRAIGYRLVDEDQLIPSDIQTNYRIWSITKLYTATMIMQLVEEGKLSLTDRLIDYYPTIPNAELITIESMLSHQSGIHDFTQNDGREDWDTYINEPKTPSFMVNHISQYPPDFNPGEGFRYSNSNYLLLGYIIESLDDKPYQSALANRITSKLGMTSTFFGEGALDHIENKANSYRYDQTWTAVNEGGFSGLIPAGAGGIVSTSQDMSLFIQGLFDGSLISPKSLDQMLPKDEWYGLGFMKTEKDRSQVAYGHTGGYIASESSLFYNPSDRLSIAYATNGIVIRKEEILDNVLKICYDQPFGISIDRKIQVTIIIAIAILIFLVLRMINRGQWNLEHLLYTSYVMVPLFWIGSVISGYMNGNYSHLSDELTHLYRFYINSGSFMSSIVLITCLLFIPLGIGLYRWCRLHQLSMIPLIPLGIIPISLAGSILFPIPNDLYPLFANCILLVVLGPILSLFIWRRSEYRPLRYYTLACLIIMLLGVVLLAMRSSFPNLVNDYRGLLQRSFFLGWSLWVIVLSSFFIKQLQESNTE